MINNVAIWEQRPEGWLDVTSGLLWFPIEPERYTYDEAMKLFNTPEKRLPTIEEWETAYQRGIYQELHSHDTWFWSSSPHPGSADLACIFGGHVGVVFYGNHYVDYSVRCVCDTRVLEFNNTLKGLMK